MTKVLDVQAGDDAQNMKSDGMQSCANRCIIVIGASAGGVEALKMLCAELPADLPAAVFIVLHVGEKSYMAGILDRIAKMPAADAVGGAKIEAGRIYVAPPGRHLLIHDDHMLLRRGPRENLARPAIDPLFRSAACSFGARTVGVILTGNLSDGTAGLRAIKLCGGKSVIQDPADAAVPDMPLSALQNVEIDHCVPMSSMAALLTELAHETAEPSPEIPAAIRLEVAIAAQEHSTMETGNRLGAPSSFVCPECHGALWEIEDGPITRYRCHTGHAYSVDSLVEAQSQDADNTLWSLLRAHQQRAEFVGRASEREASRGNHGAAQHLATRAAEYREDVRLIEDIIYRRRASTCTSVD